MERGRPGTVSLCPATGPSIWPKSAGRTRRHLERRRIVLKRFLIVLLATVCVASAQTLTQAERDRAINHLQTTRKAFLDATKGLSEAQWNFKQAPDRWSVAECAEHIALAEDFLFKIVTDQVMKAPAPAERKEDIKTVDQWVLTAIPIGQTKLRRRNRLCLRRAGPPKIRC